jgi:hypothetical protein
MNFIIKMNILIVLVLVSLVWVEPTFAAGLVPDCEGASCGSCHLVQLGNNVLKWLIGVLFVVFAILIAVGGFEMVTSGGNPAAKTSAKSKITNALIGILILLAGWLLVDTLIRGLLSDGSGKIDGRFWYEVECVGQASTSWPGDPLTDKSMTSGTATSSIPSPLPAPKGCSGGSCQPLGITCASAASCSISPDLVDNFQAFHAAAGVPGARVTEAMPPTRVHKSVCHTNGTCVDYSKHGGMSASEVVKVINAAKANGLRPVYEVHTQAQKDALVASGAPEANIKVFGNWISAPHFSIYGY